MKKSTPYPNPTQPSRRQRRLSPEAITFGVALAIVLTLVGLVLFIWVTQEQAPPVLTVVSDSEIREAEGRYYAPFTVTNTGGGTAESVQVIGELRLNGQVEEYGEQQIDFLSGGEQAEGAFVFTRDPRSGTLTVRVASYKLP